MQAVPDAFHAPAHNLRSDIDDQRSETLCGRNLRDAAAHETDAYDTDFTDPRIHRTTSSLSIFIPRQKFTLLV
jgi:hypothetical protein